MIADDLGVEPLRYFVLREYSLGGDGDFTYEALLQRYESELGNDLGNLLNRTVSMARQYLGGNVAALIQTDDGEISAENDRVKAAWAGFNPSQALEEAWALVRKANAHIEVKKPWVQAKAGQLADVDRTLAFCCAALRRVAKMIYPAMPETAGNILRQLGRNPGEAKEWFSSSADLWRGNNTAMEPPVPLFPRLEPDRKAALIAKWVPAAAAAPEPGTGAASATAPAPAAAAASAPPTGDAPGIDKVDFDRVELRAAKVLACERVPKTEKLLKLTLDIGTEQRTVISGIATAYAPEALVGRTVVYLANLKPAKIRGVVSQGMILAAGEADVLALAALDRDIPPGTRIR
jgi:methionyl-tRNA synthetase